MLCASASLFDSRILNCENLICRGIEEVITGLTRNQFVDNTTRGFESLPLRQNNFGRSLCGLAEVYFLRTWGIRRGIGTERTSGGCPRPRKTERVVRARIESLPLRQISNSRLIQSHRPTVFFLSLKNDRKPLKIKGFLLFWCITIFVVPISCAEESSKCRKALLPIKV